MRSSKIIVPHVSGDVKSVVICNTIYDSVNIDPSDITASQILALTNKRTYINDDGYTTFSQIGDVLTITIVAEMTVETVTTREGFPTFDWNLMAFFNKADPTDAATEMLSKIWWDIPVKYESDGTIGNISLGGAKNLVIVYNSSTTSDGNTELENLLTSSKAVLPHVLKELIYDVSTDSESHPQLNGKIAPKTSLTKIASKTGSYGAGTINAYDGSGEASHKSFPSTVGGNDNFTFNCIPSGITVGKKLFVHPKYGVCLYDPNTGEVFTIYSAPATFTLPRKPDGITGDYDIYLYKDRVAVFYDYTKYSVYISSVIDINGSNYTWEPCWKLDEVTTGTSGRFKFLVPSYFNIIPIIFVHNTILDNNLTDPWYLMHITSAFKNFTTSFTQKHVKILSNDNVGSQYDIYGSDTGDINLFTSQGFFDVSESSSLVLRMMTDDLMGYPDEKKKSIANNTYCRLYLSFHTLIQAIRFSKRMTGAEYRIMDCGIWILQGSKSWFIPYEPNIGGPAKTSNLIALTGTVLWIDNLCYLSLDTTTTVYTLRTMLGDSTEITNVSEMPQMKNGVGIKFVSGAEVYSEL